MPRDQLPARRGLSLAARAAAVLALCACPKIDYLPQNPVEPWPTKVLMHRGGGDASPYPQNTLPSVVYGASVPGFAGVEIDIERSESGTLWLGHDNEVLDCAGNPIGCFQDLDDSAIDGVAYCDTASTPSAPCAQGSSATCEQRYVRLADVLQALHQQFPEGDRGWVSLDIKGQYCGSLGVEDAQHMANQVDSLVRESDMGGKVIAETAQKAFLDRIMDKGTPVYVFLNALGDIDGPLSASANAGAAGISYKYEQSVEAIDADVVAGIHGVGQRIIVWTIDQPADIAAVWSMLPDVVETDNEDFFGFVPR